MTMRLIILICAAALGCSPSVPESASEGDDNVIARSGFTVEAPADSRWSQHSDDAQVSFEKRDGPISATLVAQSFRVDSFPDDQAFLRFAEARQEAVVKELEMLSEHYNSTRLGEATCLQYDGVFRDERYAASESEYLFIKGYTCRHPTIAGQATQLEFTQWSVSPTPPRIEDMLAAADAFFSSVMFTSDGA
jgi:hypothetical protein